VTDWRQRTIDTYNRSAKELAEYFRGIGPRSSYIELALTLSGARDPRVVEIGCGDGRDAAEILKYTPHYIGIDPASEAITLAQESAPTGVFHVVSATSFVYPANQDVVFAFASILHLDPNELQIVFDKVHACLKVDGIFYISTKFGEKYRADIKQDQYGERMFHYYNPGMIEETAGDRFGVVASWCETIGQTDWFEMALQKV
jgi:SAM-dependent methyltransferase